MNGEYLATLQIDRAVFHDLPHKRKGSNTDPILSEVESPIDSAIVEHLRVSLTRALRSHASYDVQFKPDAQSVVPGLIRDYLRDGRAAEQFVPTSQRLAACVHQLQTGAISPGVLAVLDCVSNGSAALGVLKLEREVGARLSRTNIGGRMTFEMSVLRDLILTEGTRLFKTALFVRTGPDTFVAGACDSQLSYATSREVAQFWLQFLGCEFLEEPSITTKRFFEAVNEYINQHVPDPTVKADFYDAVFSEMKAQRDHIAPLSFITDHISDDHRAPLRQFLAERNVPLTQFPKDVVEIASSLRRKAYHTAQGAVLSVPANKEGIVAVNPESIVIADRLSHVDR